MGEIDYKYAEDAFQKTTREKRKKIIEVAIDEFANNGYVNANINDIAAKAGISIGSMYQYFKNKEKLYQTIIDYEISQLSSALDTILNQKTDFLTMVDMIIQAIQVQTRQNINATKLYNEMTTESNAKFVDMTVRGMEGVTAKLYAAFIKDEQKHGRVRKDIEPHFFAFFLDNLFLILQFSYSSEYYKQRLKLYVSEDVFDHDDLLREQLMKFIKGAFYLHS